MFQCYTCFSDMNSSIKVTTILSFSCVWQH